MDEITSLSPSTIRKFWKKLEHDRATNKEQENGGTNVNEQQKLVLDQLKFTAEHGRRSQVFSKIVPVKERKTYFEKLATEAKAKQLKNASDTENLDAEKEPVKRLTKSRSSSNIISPRRDSGTRLSSEIPRSELATSFAPEQLRQNDSAPLSTPRRQEQKITGSALKDHSTVDVVNEEKPKEEPHETYQPQIETTVTQPHADEVSTVPADDKKDEIPNTDIKIEPPIIPAEVVPHEEEAVKDDEKSKEEPVENHEPEKPSEPETKQEKIEETPQQVVQEELPKEEQPLEEPQTPELKEDSISQPSPLDDNTAPREEEAPEAQTKQMDAPSQPIISELRESELTSSKDQDEDSSTEEENSEHDNEEKFILEDDSEEEKQKQVRFEDPPTESHFATTELVSDLDSETEVSFDEDSEGLSVEERKMLREDRMAKAQSWNVRNDGSNDAVVMVQDQLRAKHRMSLQTSPQDGHRKWYIKYQTTRDTSPKPGRSPSASTPEEFKQGRRRGSTSMTISPIQQGIQRTYETEQTHRNKVLREILETEKDYTHDLEVLVTIILRPLRQKKLLTQKELEEIFSDIEMLYNIHREFVKKFESVSSDLDQLMFGQQFLKIVDFLKVYANFCANQQQSVSTLEKCRSNNSEFDVFLRGCSRNPECKNLSLESFLIKPVQRICKYPLLLKELIRDTPEEHGDFAALNKAHQIVNEIVTQINERKRIKDNAFKLAELAEHLEGGDFLNLKDSNRWLIKDGQLELVKKSKAKRGYGYLLDNVFLWTREKKISASFKKVKYIKYVIALDKATVQESSKNTPETFVFADIEKKKKFLFRAPTVQTKKEWMEQLASVISKSIQRLTEQNNPNPATESAQLATVELLVAKGAKVQ